MRRGPEANTSTANTSTAQPGGARRRPKDLFGSGSAGLVSATQFRKCRAEGKRDTYNASAFGGDYILLGFLHTQEANRNQYPLSEV